MKGAVVYFSRWGNCREVAEAILTGIAEAGHQVRMLEAGDASLGEELDFLVVGSPTRAGRMAGPVRKFIKREVSGDWAGRPFAAFGTGMRSIMEKGEDQSADDIADVLSKKGLRAITGPFEACVEKMKGPLVEGTVDRAIEFGRKIGASLAGD